MERCGIQAERKISIEFKSLTACKMADDKAELAETPHSTEVENTTATATGIKGIYSHPWTQILLISLICFCCPGVGPPLRIDSLD